MGPVSALLDTSMLVRYLTGDPPDLADASAKVIDAEAELLISDVALVETAYVLASTYGVPRDERFPRVKNTHRPTIVINLETPFPWTSAKIGAASRNIVRKQIRSFRYRVLDLGL